MPQNPKNFRLRRAFQKGVPYFLKFQESEKKGVPYSFRQNQLKSGRRSLLRGVFIYNSPVPWTGKINFTVVSCSISELRRPFGQCFGHNEAMISPSIGFKNNFAIFGFYSNISSYPTPRTDFGLCRYYVFCCFECWSGSLPGLSLLLTQFSD